MRRFTHVLKPLEATRHGVVIESAAKKQNSDVPLVGGVSVSVLLGCLHVRYA